MTTKKTIKIPKAQALIMRTYLKFNEWIKKHYWKQILLRDFIMYWIREWFIKQDSKGRYWMRKEVNFTFEA